MGIQEREYVATRARGPSSDQVQIPCGEVVSQSSPIEPQGPQLQLHLAIRDLDDAQLREVLEEHQLETARREGMAPPLGSPLGQWQGPAGGVDADLDDRGVTSKGEGMGT